MNMAQELLQQFPSIMSFPMHWGDQDALGHVNNIIYMRWAETSRIQYLTETGAWDGSPIKTSGPILAAISCDFRLPLTFPDTVYAGASVVGLGNSSFRMIHRIVSGRHGAIAADLDSTLVWLDDSAGKPVPLPLRLRAAIEKFEGKPLPRGVRR